VTTGDSGDTDDGRCRCLVEALAPQAPDVAVLVVGPGEAPAAVHDRVEAVVAAAARRLVLVAAAPVPGGSPAVAAMAGYLAPVVRHAAVRLAGSGGTANLVLHGPLRPGPACGPGCARSTEGEATTSAGAAIIGRLVAPEEVAATVAFLVADEAAYVNGIVLPVDGGISAGRHA
jgi:NAD(P)-dependent dehydrogenase (short-subunit alcohol dehydrogenase family)